MVIRWYGQSCFLLAASSGSSLLMDPFRKFLGYSLPPLEADIVTSSHAHPDHDNVEAAGPGALVLKASGGLDAKGFSIRAVPAWHDGKQGASRGPNAIFVAEAEGLRVCHLGDIGHDLDEGRLAAIGRVDLLFVPCGGMASAGPDLAARLVERLDPAIAVPMHYRTRGLGAAGLIFAPVGKFLEACPRPVRREAELRIDAASLGGRREIVVMDWDWRRRGGR